MPKRKLAPQLAEITASDFKSRKRLIRRLAQQRLGFGKSTFFDTANHQPRYPIDIIGPALLQAEHRAIKNGRKLDFSREELTLLKQIFISD
jgi:hypothetical protein